MQVQHEVSLTEPVSNKLSSVKNQSLDSYCLQGQQSNSMCPIEHMAISPGCSNLSLLACHLSQSNQILLLDMKTHRKRDKFPLKANDKKYSRQSFQVSGIDFSPDGQRLAIAQTDCIIYIYKLSSQQTSSSSGNMTNSGTSFASGKSDDQTAIGLRPTITGKFAASSPITCMRWFEQGIVFGSQDGRVRLILSFNKSPAQALLPQATSALGDSSNQSTNLANPSSSQTPKVISIFSAANKSSMPISLTYRNGVLAVGQSDCAVTVIHLNPGAPLAPENAAQGGDQAGPTNLGDNQVGSSRRNSSISSQNFAVLNMTTFNHSCPPANLLIIQLGQQTTVCCAGSDGRVGFQQISQQQSAQARSISCQASPAIELNEDVMSMDYSKVNEVLVLATRNRLVFVKYDPDAASWRLQSSAIELRNVFTLSAIKWLRDGSQLAVGSSNSSIELFRCAWSKQCINDKLDICHIARNRIRITDRERNLLATYKTQADIKRVNLLDHGQNVLIYTTNTLLMARMSNQRLQSEIRWTQSGPDQKTPLRFLFDSATTFVIIYDESTRELSLVRLGSDSVVYTKRLPPEQAAKRSWLSLGQFPPVGQQLTPSSSSPHQFRVTSRSNSASVQKQQPSRQNGLSSSGSGGGPNLGQLEEFSSLERASPTNLSGVCERFAYVINADTLTVVDLANSNQLIYSERDSRPIEWIKFSRTSRFLACKSSSGALNLLQFRSAEQQTGTRVDKCTLLERCDGRAFWLPESDSLVAQSGPTIYLWYDLEHRDRGDVRETFDSLAFNPFSRKPLIDMSFLSGQEQHAPAHPVVERVVSSGPMMNIVLSNGQNIPLSRLKTNFYAKLASDLYESAFDLLNGQQQAAGKADTPLRPLYGKLGWMALERQGKCELAWKVFAFLDYRNLVRYLEKCLGCGEGDERELMLAKLRGDWPKFETLATDQEEVIATYRRLNKWSLLVEYLTRKQQFRQRDLTQRDHLEWLIKAGRYREAAELKVRDSSDLVGALGLLVEANSLKEAADLLIREQKLSLGGRKDALSTSALTAKEKKLRDLAETEIYDKLISRGDSSSLRQAAAIAERIFDNPERAFDLYLAAGEHSAAMDLANRRAEMRGRVREIQHKYADHLRDGFLEDPLKVSKKRANKSIDLYLGAESPLEALKMANLLREHQKGYAVIHAAERELDALKLAAGHPQTKEEILAECRKLGWLLLAEESLNESAPGAPENEGSKHTQAIKAFRVGEDYEQVVELLIDLQDFERAFEVCLEKVNGRDRRLTEAQFTELAQVWAQGGHKAEQADKLFVLMNKVELAVAMYEQLGEHDKMLELVRRYQPDQLESKLLLLARWLESEARYAEAEKYLLQASPDEWTNVVRMYRLAERWPDAYRVARANCISERDPLLVQLAYWWAKSIQPSGSLDVGKARSKLLHELNVRKQVVEFCCETKNFPFAMELLEGSHEGQEPAEESARVRREVVLRFATLLEQQHKFDQAERLLVENRLVELAVKMYTDNEDYLAAIRLIEDQMGGVTDGDKSDQGGADEKAERERLAELLNATLVESARRLVEDLTPADHRSSQLLTRAQVGPAGASQPAVNPKLLTAQQMFLRAQRPDLAIEMYQSLGMWREAIMVAQRFAPRLLEGVERALDEQVSDHIEPILRQTPSQASDREDTPPQEGERAGQPTPNSNYQDQNHKHQKALSEEAQIWRQFESSVAQGDQKTARARLDAYLGWLVRCNAGACVSARRMRTLEKFLLEMRQQRSAIVSAVVSQGGLPGRFRSLADEVFGSELGWTGCQERAMHEVRALWVGLRNILASYAKLAAGSPMPPEEPATERRVLVAHFVALHCSLVDCLAADCGLGANSLLNVKQVAVLANSSRTRQAADAFDLLAKLSFSLLRYADLVDTSRLLWLAGLWQLAGGRSQVARLLWSGLVELHDQLEGQGASPDGESRRLAAELIRSKLGRFVDVPDALRLETSPERALPARRLNQVRQWLLESLIEGGLGVRPESALPPGWACLGQTDQDKSAGRVRACRVCGLPVAAAASRRGASARTQSAEAAGLLDQTTNTLRREELFKLIGLCEIKSDKAAGGPRDIEPELERLIGEIGAGRRRGGQKPAGRRQAPRDHLGEIVEFILESAR